MAVLPILGAVGGADLAAEVGAVDLHLTREMEPFHLGGQGLPDLVRQRDPQRAAATCMQL